MKIDLHNILKNTAYKFILLCMLTIFPLIISLFVKNVYLSYLISFLIVQTSYFLLKFYNHFNNNFGFIIENKLIIENKKRPIEIEKINLQIKKKYFKGHSKDNFEALKKSIENIDNGVLVIEKIIFVKQTVNGKSKIFIIFLDKTVKKYLKNEPTLISHPKKLLEKFENHQMFIEDE